jgi:hypothetical protein
MRAISAFLNGAGSRRYLKGGSTDRGLLKLLDLFVITGVASELPLRIRQHRVRTRGPAPQHGGRNGFHGSFAAGRPCPR